MTGSLPNYGESVNALTERRSRRIATMDITPELIIELLKVQETGTKVGGMLITFLSDPVPSTATALRCGITADGNIRLVIEDDSFYPVPEGDTPERLTPTYGWNIRED